VSDRPWVRLTARHLAALDEALDPHSLTPNTRLMLEAHLTSYRNRPRPPSVRDRRALARTGRRLLALIACASVEDDREAVDLALEHKGEWTLVERLTARVAQWEGDSPRPKSRPVDQARRLLLAQALGVIDDAGFLWERRSGHRDGPRVRALRIVVQIADTLDGRPESKGSLRLITDVLRETRRQHERAARVTKLAPTIDFRTLVIVRTRLRCSRSAPQKEPKGDAANVRRHLIPHTGSRRTAPYEREDDGALAHERDWPGLCESGPARVLSRT
jgi:hypothetical protein